MSENQFIRTEMVIGREGVARIKDSSVIVFGVGGVGSYVVEALARAGVGRLAIVDKDRVEITNINRQLPALHSTLGRPKVTVMAERVTDINPQCSVMAMEMFYMPENSDELDLTEYDYIVDAIDNVTAKICLIEKAHRLGIPIISSMGTGNKLEAGMLRIDKIENTRVCPLAKIVRKELAKRDIKGVKVVYSEEMPQKNQQGIIGSMPFVPSVAGLLIAGEVIKDIAKE